VTLTASALIIAFLFFGMGASLLSQLVGFL
jgi:hypothetical protein